MDVGNMHGLRLLLATQCPLHSQDERLTGRTGAVAAVDDRIAYLQTVALSQLLDVGQLLELLLRPAEVKTLARLDAAAVLLDCSQIGCEVVVLH